MKQQRAEELLTFRAVEGLEVKESGELETLLADMPEIDDGSHEIAAAACHLALMGPVEPMPEHLRRRLDREAAVFQGKVLPMPESPAAPRSEAPAPAARPARAGWLAAAACLLLALIGWWPRLMGPPAEIAEPTVELSQPAPEGADDALELPWQATDDEAAAGAAGAVVWSTARQDGYMRIRGLAANDPSVNQYQLWIFDQSRDERYPVDGGVFDVPAGVDEVRVPIDAKIAVDQPYLFAVTVEKPGGVVVSERQRIVLLAQAEA